VGAQAPPTAAMPAHRIAHVGRGSLLCTTGLSLFVQEGSESDAKRGRDWKRIDTDPA
jgi:hypothetical protein